MSHAHNSIFTLASRTLAVCLLLVTALSVSQARAQGDYLEMEFADELRTEAAQTNAQSLKTQVLIGNEPLSSAREDFRRWYVGYQFPRMTRIDSRTALPELRRDVYADLTRASRSSPEAHQELVTLCFEVSKRVVAEDYHPAVRYNFMRLMGDLNTEESESGAPPVPLPAAMVEMLKAVNDPEQIDAVKVAALIGINRHVETLLVSSDQAQFDTRREGITRVMLALIDSLNERSGVEGLAWMKRQALEILAHLGQVGENGQVYASTMALMSDPSEPLFLRCAAAQALSQFTYPGSFDVAADEIYTQLGLLAYDCCKRELDRVQDWQEEHMPVEDDLPRGRVPGRRGGSADADAIYEAGSMRQALAMRLIIKEQLGSIDRALQKTQPLASGADERDLYTAVSSAVNDALKAVDQREDDRFYLEDFIDGIEGPTADLDDLLGATGQQEVEADEPAEEDEGDDPLGLGAGTEEDTIDPLLDGDEVDPAELEAPEDPSEGFVPP